MAGKAGHSGRKLGSKNRAEDLKLFAERIEKEVLAATGEKKAAMERLICRLLTGNNPILATTIALKWVEWRYGKPKEGDKQGDTYIQINAVIPRPNGNNDLHAIPEAVTVPQLPSEV